MTVSNRPNWTMALGLPLLVAIVCVLIPFTPAFSLHPDSLSTGIALDLTLTAPLLYFFAIRNSRVSKATTIRVFVLGVLLAGLLLRHHPNAFLAGIRTWISPVVETVVLFVIFRKIWLSGKAGKGSVRDGEDFLSRCRTIGTAVTGSERAGGILASEIGTFYYGFISRRAKNIDYRSGFTVYKDNGILLILGVFIVCFLVETVGMHLLIAHWSVRTAWILTTLGAYTGLQLWAHARALRSRPVQLMEEGLHLRNGLAGEVYIAYDQIEGVETAPKQIRTNGQVQGNEAKKKGVGQQRQSPAEVRLTLLGTLENPTIQIRVKQPVTVIRMLGLRRQAITILFCVDRPKEFLAAVRAKLAEKAGQPRPAHP